MNWVIFGYFDSHNFPYRKGATKVATYGRYGKRTGCECPFETVYSAAAITSPKRWMPSRMVSASALVKFRRIVEYAPGWA